MKYGKWLRDEIERTFPEWKGQFISYKKLKKQLKLINSRWPRFATTRFLEVNNMRLSIGFTRLLNNELNKINMFYFDKEEDYIIRLKVFCWSFLPGLLVQNILVWKVFDKMGCWLQELQDRAEELASDEEKLQVQKDILKFHGEMVLLLNYSVLNFTGASSFLLFHAFLVEFGAILMKMLNIY